MDDAVFQRPSRSVSSCAVFQSPLKVKWFPWRPFVDTSPLPSVNIRHCRIRFNENASSHATTGIHRHATSSNKRAPARLFVRGILFANFFFLSNAGRLPVNTAEVQPRAKGSIHRTEKCLSREFASNKVPPVQIYSAPSMQCVLD